MFLVIIFLVCKHPDKLTPNPIIPFRDSISEKSKNLGSNIFEPKKSTLVLQLWILPLGEEIIQN